MRKYKFKWRYDRCSGNCNLSNCKLTRKKKFRDFNGIRIHGICVTLQCSTNWAMKTHTLGAGQFVEFILTRERNETEWRWCELRKYKFLLRYDRHSGNYNLSNCKLNRRKIGDLKGFEPMASAKRCSALSTKLWRPIYWVHTNYTMYFRSSRLKRLLGTLSNDDDDGYKNVT